MGLITWSEKFSVNVEELDQQHKKLVGLINELNEAMSVGKGKDVLRRIVDDLARYASTHCRAEEKYFARFEYPDTFNHRIEHIALMKKVAAFKERFDNGNQPLSVEVLRFMSEWLKRHIMETDRKYSRFFNEKGLK